MTLSIVSNNVKGLRGDLKRQKLFIFFADINSSFTCLQETHSDLTCEGRWKGEWGGNIIFSHGTSNSMGVAILCKGNEKINSTFADENGRYVGISIINESKTVVIMSVYAPNSESEQVSFYNKILQILADLAFDELILCGDFNICMNLQLDKKGGTEYTKRSKQSLDNILMEFNLVDSWRKRNPHTKRYTWKQNDPEVHCRLDYFFVTKSLDVLVRLTSIIHVPHTDHKGIQLVIKLTTKPRGPSFWKHNNSLLSNAGYREEMAQVINQAWEEGRDIEDLRIRYDYMKYKIRQFSIKFSKQLAKERHQKEKDLQEKIAHLEEKGNREHLSDKEQETLAKFKMNLEEIYRYKVQGEIMRSRIEQIEHDEKSTAFFFRRSKTNYEKKTIEELEINGNVTDDSHKIANEIKLFYSKLYSTTQNETAPSLWEYNEKLEGIRHLTLEEKETLNDELTTEELAKALQGFKDNKSPGNDGLSAEFFKTFWKDIGGKLLETIKFSTIKGELPISFRRGIITLLPKPNKDSLQIKNYRPISLLNCDYKILAKSIANRLGKYIPTIINRDQTGFVAGRYIGQNIRAIDDVMWYAKQHNLSGLVMQLDFEKAYDSIEWKFLFEVLEKFQIGVQITEKIKLLYNNIFSTVINDGLTCGWFRLERGVRQGCPLSCFLFIMCVEIMAELVRKTPNIQGITINGVEKKISQFADDTTCLLGNENSVAILFEITELFQRMSGLKLNKEKCEMMWIGAWDNRQQTTQDLKLQMSSLNILGVHVGHNKQRCRLHNFDQKVEKLKTRLAIWRQRQLTIIGRILISKAHGISNLVYSMSTQYTNEKLLKPVHAQLCQFIWNFKSPKVKYRSLMASYNKGGLRAPNIFLYNKAIKLAWLSRLLQDVEWNPALNELINKYGGWKIVLNSNSSATYFQVPDFYQQIIKFFYELMVVPHKEQILWNNKLIKIRNKPIFWRDWYEEGITCILDVLDERQNVLTLDEFAKKFGILCKARTYKLFRNAVKRAIDILDKNGVKLFVVSRQNIERTIFRTRLDNFVDIRQAKCKDYYSELAGMESSEPVALQKWKQSHNISNEMFYNSFNLHRKSCQDAKLLTFQYKLLNNLVANNKNLTKWKIKNCPNCLHCQEEDTSWHMFIECPNTVNHLKAIMAILKIDKIVPLEFMFGSFNPAVNVIYMTAKRYIWMTRFHEKQFKLREFINELKWQISADANKLTNRCFKSKWEEFIDIMAV